MKLICAIAVVGAVHCCVFAEQSRELSDAAVGEFVAKTLARKRHGVDKTDFDALFKYCRCDSNRYCRIAQDVYARYEDWQTRLVAIDMISRYGDMQQVPFLESCVTNVALGPAAISALNRIEGFTSNSVLRTARYHSVTNQGSLQASNRLYSNRRFALDRIAFAATRPAVGTGLKNYTRDYVFSYASNNCSQIYTTDHALMSLDPSYANSKRRLALLRFACSNVSGPFATEYVTNAINELVAYPEANLPE